jgi:hypothetical protein
MSNLASPSGGANPPRAHGVVTVHRLIDGLICTGSWVQSAAGSTLVQKSNQFRSTGDVGNDKKTSRSLRAITIIQKGEESIRRFEPLGEEPQHVVLRSDGRMTCFIDQTVGQNAVPNGCCA